MKILFKKIKIDKKRFIRNALILLIILSIGLIIDQTSKYYIFNKYSSVPSASFKIADYKILAFRLATNTGMMSSLGEHLPFWTVQLITSLIAGPILIAVFFVKTKFQVIGLALIGCGALGNIIDRYATNGHFVMDWIYLPWVDGGTFNIADVLVISGSATMFVSLIISIFKKDKETK